MLLRTAVTTGAIALTLCAFPAEAETLRTGFAFYVDSTSRSCTDGSCSVVSQRTKYWMASGGRLFTESSLSRHQGIVFKLGQTIDLINNPETLGKFASDIRRFHEDRYLVSASFDGSRLNTSVDNPSYIGGEPYSFNTAEVVEFSADMQDCKLVSRSITVTGGSVTVLSSNCVVTDKGH
jgi:hypothetical protein